MKKILSLVAAGLISLLSFSQDIDKMINSTEVERIEKVLSADDMQGRKTFTPGIDKAADFIAAEFTKNKLKFYGDNKSYSQEFSMIKTKPVSSLVLLDMDTVPAGNFVINTSSASLDYTSMSGLEIVLIKKEDDFFKSVQLLLESGKNLLVLVDTAHATRFKRLKSFTGRARFSSPWTQVFILTSDTAPNYFELHQKNELTVQQLKNVVGILPGRSKKKEYVVFSGHYDHLGIGKPNKDMDSIYNGANDDAAGTAAVIMLSKYFSERKEKNERTLVFVAFTAEEIGGFGSRYFSKQINPDEVVAMFNIEMIGTDSKWGNNSAYITGYERSDMGKILQANLADSKFHFEPDPYPAQNLFYRSDNATLAALGVPAHTISTSKMDSEKFYHTPGDEITTLDMNNMAEIIKAIAISSKTIVSGKDTPSRIERIKD